MSNLVSGFPSHAARLPEDVCVQLPHGLLLGATNASVKLTISKWSSMACLKAGQIGALAEDYVEGTLQLDGAMRDVMGAVTRLLPGNPVASDTGWWTGLLRRAKSVAAHTPHKDAAQVQFHYDVSDAFYALWLDPQRVYSCAYYRDLTDTEITLQTAQEAKLDHICRKLMLKPGERFLDIGCGWGALLLWAAEHYGVQATGITLSKNQHVRVQQLVAQKGLSHRVSVQLRDYRDLQPGPDLLPFDKISSVGMFEHVGHANMTAYFAKIMSLLVPGGLVMNHGITAGGLDNRQLGAGMGDFIEKYIFPGGELLHVSAMLEHMARGGLELVDAENLRPHYARTLWAWSNALESRLDEARRVLSADGGPQAAEKTLRAYRLYLAGSAMSFEQGWLSLHQLLATRPLADGSRPSYPFTRDHMYGHPLGRTHPGECWLSPGDGVHHESS